jgi:nicotinamide mononucleotide (NMN) deamidase PncC
MAEADFLEIQRALVNHEKAKFLAKQARLQKDVRSQIARSGFYQPDNDPVYEFQPFPETVKVGDTEIIVFSQEEKDKVLGIKAEPAKKVDVDITQLVQEQTAVPVKRKYTKRVVMALPADLK